MSRKLKLKFKSCQQADKRAMVLILDVAGKEREIEIRINDAGDMVVLSSFPLKTTQTSTPGDYHEKLIKEGVFTNETF